MLLKHLLTQFVHGSSAERRLKMRSNKKKMQKYSISFERKYSKFQEIIDKNGNEKLFELNREKNTSTNDVTT